MNPVPNNPDTSNKRRRWPWLLGILLLAIIGGALLLPKLIDPNQYRDELDKLIGNALGGEVELGALQWGLGSSVWLQAESVAIKNAELLPIDLQTGHVEVRLALAPLLKRSLVFEYIDVAKPILTWKLQDPVDDETDVDSSGDDTSGSALDIRFQSLHISDGRLMVQERRTVGATLPADIDLSVLMLGIKDLAAGSEATFELDVTLDSAAGEQLGSLLGSGSFLGLAQGFTIDSPHLSFHAELKQLTTAAQQILVPEAYRQNKLEGKVSASIDYQGNLGERGSVNGSIDLGELSYRDPSLWPQPLHASSGRVQLRLDFDPQQLRVKQLELELGDLSAVANADIDNWSDEAVLKNTKLQAQLPLAELSTLMPWAKLGKDAPILRDLLGGGGSVQIENVEMPELALTRLPEDNAELLRSICAAVKLSGLSVEAVPMLPRVERISGQLELREGTLQGSGISAMIGPLTLPVIRLQASELLGKTRVEASAKGPMVVAAKTDKKVEALLTANGLSHLSGSAEVDFKLHYDQAKPQHWDTKGSIQLDELKFHTIKTDADFEMHGKLDVRRKSSLDVALVGLKGLVNQAPFALDGEIMDIGSEQLLVDLDLHTDKFELSPLTELVPALEHSQLHGLVTSKLSVYFLKSKPKATDLRGTLVTEQLGLLLPGSELRLEQLNARLDLAANRINITQMQGQLNDQPLSLQGHLVPLPYIHGELKLASPNLDFNKLLPEAAAEKPQATVAETDAPTTKPQLPEALRTAELKLSASIDKGQYRKVPIEQLDLQLDYAKGKLRDHSFKVNFDHGTIATQGSVDINNLDHIPFDIHYQIDSVLLENVLVIIGLEAPTPSGPLSSSGHISGRSGSKGELARSLRGDLSVTAGPGKIPKVGYFGKAVFNVLSVINVEGLLKGKLEPGLAIQGVPYNNLGLQATFVEEGMRLDQIGMDTPATSAQGKGILDFGAETVDLAVAITVLGTLDKALGLVPLVGTAAANATKAYLEIKGPMAGPKVRIRQGKGFIDSLELEDRKPGWRIRRDYNRTKESLSPSD